MLSAALLSLAALAIDLGTYACTPLSSTEGQVCRTNADYSGMVVYASAIYAFGGGHSATYKDNVAVFNPAGWSEPTGATPCVDLNWDNIDHALGRWITTNHPIARHTYDLQAVAGDQIILMASVQGRGAQCNSLPPVDATHPNIIASSVVAHYSITSGTWSYTSVPALTYDYAIETDPVSGKVLVVSRTGLWMYDPAAQALTKYKSWSLPMGYSASLVYAANTDRFYWLPYAGVTQRTVYEIALDRTTPANSTITTTTAVLPSITTGCCSAGWAYDSDHGLIGGGSTTNTFYALNPVTYAVNTIPLTSNDGVTIDPMHGYSVGYIPGIGYIFRTKGTTYRTWMYKP